MSYSNELGRIGEQMVADFLRARGYIIFYRNYRSSFGEIDIIAEDREKLLFVEVKTRSSDSLMSPADAVDAIKRDKIIRTAKSFRTKAHHTGKYRFDIAEVLIDGKKIKINYIKDAFI